MTISTTTLILTRSDVAGLLTLADCIPAVEKTFELLGAGSAAPPGMLGLRSASGGFHIKAGLLNLSRNYFAAKTNANFPDNPGRFGLPLIQGVIALFDGENGMLLALMDSIEITIIRTGAATAVAARYLARRDSKTATICGCGNQGRISLKALLLVRKLEKVIACDLDAATARQFADEFAGTLETSVVAIDQLPEATGQSQICVTCTPSTRHFLRKADVAPGTFIAAVGADNSRKQELEPALLASCKVIVDSLEQCASDGDLHHALELGLLRRENVHAELGAIVAGRSIGRASDEEVIVFDSTGLALQDVAAAALVYERALTSGAGVEVNLGT